MLDWPYPQICVCFNLSKEYVAIQLFGSGIFELTTIVKMSVYSTFFSIIPPLTGEDNRSRIFTTLIDII